MVLETLQYSPSRIAVTVWGGARGHCAIVRRVAKKLVCRFEKSPTVGPNNPCDTALDCFRSFRLISENKNGLP